MIAKIIVKVETSGLLLDLVDILSLPVASLFSATVINGLTVEVGVVVFEVLLLIVL